MRLEEDRTMTATKKMRVDLKGQVRYPVTATLELVVPADATPDEIAELASELERQVPWWAAPDGSPQFPVGRRTRRPGSRPPDSRGAGPRGGGAVT
jgi:hypothetical protein